jgi:hypothetical protein
MYSKCVYEIRCLKDDSVLNDNLFFSGLHKDGFFFGDEVTSKAELFREVKKNCPERWGVFQDRWFLTGTI